MPFRLPISKFRSHSERSILMDRMAKINVLICASGSVAALKIPEICVELSADDSIDFRIVCSEASLHFLRNSAKYNPYVWSQFESCGGMSLVFTDDDEWRLWSAIGDPVLHVELSKWAHILVVAPASADIIAKIHAGIADSLLLCVVRAWNISKPCLLCPAMNTVMWNQHVTEVTLDALRISGWHIISPISKTLACNDTGMGAMANVKDIVGTLLLHASSESASSPYDNTKVRGLIGGWRDVVKEKKGPTLRISVFVLCLSILQFLILDK